jgi:hypothetical protein
MRYELSKVISIGHETESKEFNFGLVGTGLIDGRLITPAAPHDQAVGRLNREEPTVGVAVSKPVTHILVHKDAERCSSSLHIASPAQVQALKQFVPVEYADSVVILSMDAVTRTALERNIIGMGSSVRLYATDNLSFTNRQKIHEVVRGRRDTTRYDMTMIPMSVIRGELKSDAKPTSKDSEDGKKPFNWYFEELSNRVFRGVGVPDAMMDRAMRDRAVLGTNKCSEIVGEKMSKVAPVDPEIKRMRAILDEVHNWTLLSVQGYRATDMMGNIQRIMAITDPNYKK